eukprot:CAMPEP_0198231528 /NCGR_PEP_ID=MMETSP1445-20131203/115251_1 /TAXON_ID=36898 /ORGANISM="Pyramimonas sp., Strain CCMP2087" /LENGTH=70 /DNA_ID=CAMNT_0043912149 /DNA_START=637 /DNA_END=849 /DNA_ORIENTATION=-
MSMAAALVTSAFNPRVSSATAAATTAIKGTPALAMTSSSGAVRARSFENGNCLCSLSASTGEWMSDTSAP